MKYYHEMDVTGRHRLGRSKNLVTEVSKSSDITWGEWAPYSVPAKLGTLCAVTNCYTGSTAFPDPAVLYKLYPATWPLIKVYDGSSDGV